MDQSGRGKKEKTGEACASPVVEGISIQFSAAEFVVGVVSTGGQGVTICEERECVIDPRVTHAPGRGPGACGRIVRRARASGVVPPEVTLSPPATKDESTGQPAFASGEYVPTRLESRASG